jgi:hypothetical protein
MKNAIALSNWEVELLAQYLDEKYRARLAKDRLFSIKKWADEIGVNDKTLTSWMHAKKGGDLPRMELANLRKLIHYFGAEFMDRFDLNPPAKGKSP